MVIGSWLLAESGLGVGDWELREGLQTVGPMLPWWRTIPVTLIHGKHMRFLFAILAFASSVRAASIGIAVVDEAGLPLKDILVVVQKLEPREEEICRTLTNQQGRARGVELPPGLYRAIATTPYGLWSTTAVEFLAPLSAGEVTLEVHPVPTRGYGDIATVGKRIRDIQVLQASGQPAVAAEVLVRDKEATLQLERRYKTDASGKAKIELVGTPTIAVVVFEGILVSQEVGDDEPATIRLGVRKAP